jgi:hypothetical protein
MSAPLNDNNPHVAPIEDAKQGIQTFAMFYYQTLLDAGFDKASAKDQTASLLEQQYYFFCEQGKVEAKSIGTVKAKLTRAIETVKQEAKANPTLRIVYNDLLSIQSQVNKQ